MRTLCLKESHSLEPFLGIELSLTVTEESSQLKLLHGPSSQI